MQAFRMTSHLLAMPRELRNEVYGQLALPMHVYTSTTMRDYHISARNPKTYIDTRIYLPSRIPINILATCRQLRQEALEHHAHQLNSVTLQRPIETEPRPMSSVLAERTGTEFLEEAERVCDDGTLRITLEVQRKLRGLMGYAVPLRDALSPQLLHLLPLMQRTHSLRLAIWPGYEWWNGGPQPLTDKYGNLRVNVAPVSKPNDVTVAIEKLLEVLPEIEELKIDILMQSSEASNWDLPDRKWENIQAWLDTPIFMRGHALQKVTRRLIAFWKASEPEPFYTQLETRQVSGSSWKVERKGNMATKTILSYCDDPEDLEFLTSLTVEECFDRAHG